METALQLLSWGLVLAGAFFMLTGALGLLRFPDVFTRMHAAGMTDTMGAGLILAGLCFQGDGITALRLLLILAFLWFTSPVSTHALARAALQGGLRPVVGKGAQPDPAQPHSPAHTTVQPSAAPAPSAPHADQRPASLKHR